MKLGLVGLLVIGVVAATVVWSSLPVQASGADPEFPHYAGGEGVLPSGETFSFSVGHRWDGADLGWLRYQRPGWRPFTATQITHVQVYGEDDVDVWGMGAFWDDPAIPFHLVLTGNQSTSKHHDSFRMYIWPGLRTPVVNSSRWLLGEAPATAWLSRGAIRVASAHGS